MSKPLPNKVKGQPYLLADCAAGDCFYKPGDKNKTVYKVSKRAPAFIEYRQKYTAQGKGNPIKNGSYSTPIIFLNHE